MFNTMKCNKWWLTAGLCGPSYFALAPLSSVVDGVFVRERNRLQGVSNLNIQ